MNDYSKLNSLKTKKHDKLFAECELFFAFSPEQFLEGKAKHPLDPGDKYISIGAGGYLPNKHLKQFVAGMESLDKWYKKQVKLLDLEKVIIYELNNYECFYTGDISDCVRALKDYGITSKQISKVYYANYEKQEEQIRERIGA